MPERKKAAAYHGVSNMKFAPKAAGAYETPFRMLYAKSISLNAQVSATEQYADNRLVCRIPSDTGYEGEIGTTAQDVAVEKAGGTAIEGANGLVTGNVTRYLRGALYYEHLEMDEDGIDSVVKTWVYGVELGKGSKVNSTDQAAVELGAYTYPIRAHGETLMDSAGESPWLDERGVGRMAFLYSAWPEDEGYAAFGETVPAPKVAGSAETS